jgi:hypothetical protein
MLDSILGRVEGGAAMMADSGPRKRQETRTNDRMASRSAAFITRSTMIRPVIQATPRLAGDCSRTAWSCTSYARYRRLSVGLLAAFRKVASCLACQCYGLC